MKYKLGEIAPIKQALPLEQSEYWLLNLDMIESNTGKIIKRIIVKKEDITQSTIFFDSNNVLYSKLRPYLNKVVLPDSIGYGTSELLPLCPNEKIITKEYLANFLRSESFVNYINGKTNGAKMPRVNVSDFLNTEIECPSIIEQRKINNRLEKLSNLLTLRNQQLEKLDLLVKSRFIEMTKNNDSVKTPMGDIATFINGYGFKPSDWSTEGFPIIRIQNLNDSKAEYNHFNGKLDEKYRVHNGDVLVSWATHLEAYYWNGSDAWLNQHIFKAVFDKIEVDKTFYIYAANVALKEAFKHAHGFKATMEHLKRSDFEKSIVLLPNINIQKDFGRFVQQVDKSKFVIKQSIEKLELLKSKLMQDYFG